MEAQEGSESVGLARERWSWAESQEPAISQLPNCAKNCVVTHQRWPTQLTQNPVFPTLTGSHQRQNFAYKAAALPTELRQRNGHFLQQLQHL